MDECGKLSVVCWGAVCICKVGTCIFGKAVKLYAYFASCINLQLLYLAVQCRQALIFSILIFHE